MSNSWVRLWLDMPNDPKWRVIAKKSGRPVSEVIAVFVHMLTNAGANATERGELRNWSDEDIAAAIDAQVEHVTAIRSAMDGKTLDGMHLKSWEKRQPKREDNSAERAKRWRERRRTQANAPDAESDADADAERAAQSAPAVAQPPKSGLENIGDRLIKACNGALDNPVNCQGLLSLVIPQMWINEGADLELDVIPTLEAAGKKHHGKRIRSWQYFNQMIADAKATRLAGLPSGTATTVGKREPWVEEKLKGQREALRIAAEMGFN